MSSKMANCVVVCVASARHKKCVVCVFRMGGITDRQTRQIYRLVETSPRTQGSLKGIAEKSGIMIRHKGVVTAFPNVVGGVKDPGHSNGARKNTVKQNKHGWMRSMCQTGNTDCAEKGDILSTFTPTKDGQRKSAAPGRVVLSCRLYSNSSTTHVDIAPSAPHKDKTFRTISDN